ncbi:MAG: (2Fe-2S) ferredoxin domain-containing protein [Phormidesmis sp.]
MNVLQGRYLKPVNSKGGKLKGLKIKTDSHTQTVYLPKDLRAIALQELSLGDPLRVWTETKKKSRSSLWALQLIPLAPKAAITQSQSNLDHPKPEKSDSKKSRDKTVKKSKKKKGSKKTTVQLCQKKNCCKRGGTQLWSTFESAKDTAAAKSFKLEAVGCLGGCKHGPNLRFLPDNVKHYHVQPEDVDKLLAKYGVS